MKVFAAKLNTVIDPAPHLGKIEARLLAVNFAGDLINPPELGILEREIRHVKRGRAIVVPMSEHTRGHGTHTLAAVWKGHLAELLSESKPELGITKTLLAAFIQSRLS